MKSRSLAPLLLFLLALQAGPTTAAPLTEEDVVRRFVAGCSTEELLREIERAEPDFDLSPEMLEELARAGLPDSLIQAMRQRQQIQAPSEFVPPRLVIRINPNKKRTGQLRIGTEMDPQLAAEWEMGNRPEERTFVGIALYVACVTPDHVPHQWRSRSPLGRDFASTERHRMLLFEPNLIEGETRSRPDEVIYDLPPTLDVELEPEIEHDLILGIALQVTERYLSWTSDAWDDLVLSDENQTLDAVIRGHRTEELRVRFER